VSACRLLWLLASHNARIDFHWRSFSSLAVTTACRVEAGPSGSTSSPIVTLCFASLPPPILSQRVCRKWSLLQLQTPTLSRTVSLRLSHPSPASLPSSRLPERWWDGSTQLFPSTDLSPAWNKPINSLLYIPLSLAYRVVRRLGSCPCTMADPLSDPCALQFSALFDTLFFTGFVVALHTLDLALFLLNLVTPAKKPDQVVPPAFSPDLPPSFMSMPITWLLCAFAKMAPMALQFDCESR
jgi:hypothetical protein